MKDLAISSNRTGHGGRSPSSRRGGSRQSSPAKPYERKPFTRSKSPAVHNRGYSSGQSLPPRPMSPSIFARQKVAPSEIRHLLPSFLYFPVRVLPWATKWKVTLDLRQGIENGLLICSLGFAAVKMRGRTPQHLSPEMWNTRDKLSPEMWISLGAALYPVDAGNLLTPWTLELALLTVACSIYFALTRLSWNKVAPTTDTSSRQTNQPDRPASPRFGEARDSRRTPILPPNSLSRSSYFGFVWMTVPKNYR